MKATLVVDIPNTCYDCKFRQADNDRVMCIAGGKETKAKIKPKWCPLKPIPKQTKPITDVVRCEVCEFSRDKGLDKYECLLTGISNDADGYCNHGIRRCK